MKLYLLSQNENTDYDTYDSIVVCAPDEETARNINPNGSWKDDIFSTWCSSPKHVKVKYIGEASEEIKEGIILASFNAG